MLAAIILASCAGARTRTRFDERKPQAKRVNAQLANLDDEYASLAIQIEGLRAEVIGRCGAWLDSFNRWRLYSAGAKAFGIAFGSYIASALAMRALDPLWSQQLSYFVAEHIWLRVDFSP